MLYDEVIKHVENVSGLKKEEFASSSKEYIRIFNYAENNDNECIIVRFYDGKIGPVNGDKTKQHIKDKLGFICEDIDKKGNIVHKYKIIGIEERFTSGTVKKAPSMVLSVIKDNSCNILNTYSNLEDDHRYYYHLYDDPDFNANPNNWRKLHKVAQSIDRERRAKMKETGIKYDNREQGCLFHTVWGTSKYDELEATIEQPSLGIWWENPTQINLRDKELFFKYQKILSNYSIELIITYINKLTMKEFRIENIDEIINKIRNG